MTWRPRPLPSLAPCTKQVTTAPVRHTGANLDDTWKIQELNLGALILNDTRNACESCEFISSNSRKRVGELMELSENATVM